MFLAAYDSHRIAVVYTWKHWGRVYTEKNLFVFLVLTESRRKYRIAVHTLVWILPQHFNVKFVGRQFDIAPPTMSVPSGFNPNENALVALN